LADWPFLFHEIQALNRLHPKWRNSDHARLSGVAKPELILTRCTDVNVTERGLATFTGRTRPSTPTQSASISHAASPAAVQSNPGRENWQNAENAALFQQGLAGDRPCADNHLRLHTTRERARPRRHFHNALEKDPARMGGVLAMIAHSAEAAAGTSAWLN
jgi:hypothetical protein